MVGYVPQNIIDREHPPEGKPYPGEYHQVLQGGYRHDVMHYTDSELAIFRKNQHTAPVLALKACTYC